jgi:uncharacterized protein (TIGR03067 family)
MLRSGFVFLSVALLVTAPAAAQETKKESLHSKLLGQWTYTSGQRAGESVDLSRLAGKVTFRKTDLTLPAGPSDNFLIAYSIDESKNPATIDLSIKDGPVKEGKSLGILKLEGDTLTLCYQFGGTERPTKFESTAENGAHLFVLKKQPAVDASKLIGDWSYVSGKRAGQESDASRLIGPVTFKKETVSLPAGPDVRFVMGYKIDPSKTPATIDLEIKEGPVQGGKAKGIIKLDGDQLSLCYAPEGMERPKDFSSTEDDGNYLFVLKRQK